ncbi:MAG: GTP 3',8-cyclase MoaA [Aquabacterium sp.]|uniref:GTP 3',8-cyclase MoaA n=1 Tax=Aquabacterium sp. TaxID=1872578 RepID=UPI0025B7CC30|nr:GTP 3',8-cyclase MoaA [Aquabacterium sp.]MBI5927084.1 GTP 3',8-cyclase MoaA [Aquabacterium sp.]
MAPEATPTSSPPLTDQHGRRISYLRLSITDRCNFRCVYCMAENMQFMPRDELLSVDEMVTVAASFVHLGVRKIRLTGGEPLAHPAIVSLVAELSALPGLDELAMTTNGSQLSQLAPALKVNGLSRLNISLDSLQPDRFKALTRTGRLRDVLDGIQAAKAAGFQRIKLNSVILRGRNDDEVVDLVRFARQHELDIAFIEEMPLGVIDEHDRAATFMPSADILARVNETYPLTASIENSGGPARYHRMADSTTRVGVISPHSHNFCGSCNRVRLTASGQLMLCLGNEDAVDLRTILRAHPGQQEPIRQAITEAMTRKPERHHFRLDAPPQIIRFMNATGG